MPLETPDITELRALVDWVNLTPDVRHLSLSYGDVQLVVSRDRVTASAPTPPAAAAPQVAAPAPSPAPVDAPASPPPAAAPPAPAPVDQLAADEVLVKAPMVGTFYASPKPGDPAFVKVGDTVTASTVVGIVEVMKLMNNLEAKVDGTVARILVENEQAVEYGQPLMVITRNG
jgi:acetyl-CoA carboxylase biotin carboxyl carrier protein